LLIKARAIAKARALPPANRWRDARLLWPLFGRGQF
jgi:hypothetical protein